MTRMLRRLATGMMRAASCLLPPHLAPWTRAMHQELTEIERDRAALSFAAGCLRAILVLALAARLRSAWAGARKTLSMQDITGGQFAMTSISRHPRSIGLVCGAAAVGLGIAYMAAAGAPGRYLFVNLAALLLGATAWLALRPASGARLAGAGLVTCAFALLLLLTALFGGAVDGAARWVSVGPLSLQISLIVLPLMLVMYARQPDIIGTIGLIVAALALAVQPDRAMTGVLLAGLLALAIAKPGPLQIAAAAASALAFGWTLLAPDTLSAVPFVDRILYSAFDIGLFTGAGVVIGAFILLLPAGLAFATRAGDRAPLLVFGGCWAGVVAAAALGNYPTPLVGYGGSAVLGYLLSVALLPAGLRAASQDRSPPALATDPDRDGMISKLRGATLA